MVLALFVSCSFTAYCDLVDAVGRSCACARRFRPCVSAPRVRAVRSVGAADHVRQRVHHVGDGGAQALWCRRWNTSCSCVQALGARRVAGLAEPARLRPGG